MSNEPGAWIDRGLIETQSCDWRKGRHLRPVSHTPTMVSETWVVLGTRVLFPPHTISGYRVNPVRESVGDYDECHCLSIKIQS